MRTTKTIPKQYPVHEDMVLIFDDEKFDHYELKAKLYNIMERNNSEEMSSSKAGTPQLYLLCRAIEKGLFDAREMKILQSCIHELQRETSSMLGLLDNYITENSRA